MPCDFISWIEKDGHLFYIDNASLRDRFVRKKMIGSKDTDVIGHGFLRHVYNIEGGRNFEVREFWKTKKLPKEIADKMKDFDNNFKEVFTYFNNADFRCIIRYAPEKYKKLAWNMFVKNTPSRNDLLYVIEHGNDKYKELARRKL